MRDREPFIDEAAWTEIVVTVVFFLLYWLASLVFGFDVVWFVP